MEKNHENEMKKGMESFHKSYDISLYFVKFVTKKLL